MSREYNVKQVSTGQIVATGVASVGSQIAHPQNCKTECPYGRNRAFCFPCMLRFLVNRRKEGKYGLRLLLWRTVGSVCILQNA